MRESFQKLKMLYLMKILLEKTDDEHPITVSELILELSKHGISAERRSIYSDLEHLRAFGLDICSRKAKTTGYYIGSRTFELPELKLLVDSVQASKFITHKKSRELISKIETLTSQANAKKLQRQVFISNRVKTLNEKIYYNVDKIHEAIAANRQITFRYFYFDVDKNKIYRKDGGLYQESPVALTWDDENYYLITYKEKYSSYVHYRVDKMEQIALTEFPRILPAGSFDLSQYAKSVFQMYGGQETEVSIQFVNELVGVVYDRFGIDVPLIKSDAGHFVCRPKVAVSPYFLSWIISFGTRAKILSPNWVVQQLCQMLDETLENYRGIAPN